MCILNPSGCSVVYTSVAVDGQLSEPKAAQAHTPEPAECVCTAGVPPSSDAAAEVPAGSSTPAFAANSTGTNSVMI